jgi:hypothetical protein
MRNMHNHLLLIAQRTDDSWLFFRFGDKEQKGQHAKDFIRNNAAPF